MELDFTRPGKSVDNTRLEVFHGTFRRECLSQHCFSGLEEARRTIHGWKDDYNKTRPHGSLEKQTPVAFAGGGDFTRAESGSKIRSPSGPSLGGAALSVLQVK